MHQVTVKGILSNQNGMNLYRGCTHGCIYCDSRSKCYQINHAFEDIEVKENACELLEQALLKKRKKCMIGTGSMSDPYIPLEATLKHTRTCLEKIEQYGFGVAIQTKSDLILRDLDLLEAIHKKTKAVVQMTLTTYDEKLCRLLEPNVASTQRRIAVLEACQKRNIPTIVWLSPILPFLNDTEENLMGILNECARVGVKGILCFGFGLTLREGNRDYFYEKLDALFPGLKERYQKRYHDSYEVLSPNHKKLNQMFQTFCQEHAIMCDNNTIFAYLREFPEKCSSQLSLFM